MASIEVGAAVGRRIDYRIPNGYEPSRKVHENIEVMIT